MITTPALTEAQLLGLITQMAGHLGWWAYHTRDSRGSQPGFPDLVLAHRKHGVVFAELKREGGRLSRDQEFWLDTLRASGQHAYVWRPADLSEIESVLRGRLP